MVILKLPHMLKASDIKEYLNISQATAYELMRRKDFPVIVLGKSKRVKREDFLEWLEKQKQVTP